MIVEDVFSCILGFVRWRVHPGSNYGGGDAIVDVESEEIVALIPGRPHNYDLSQDFRYLLSGESNNPDCDEAQYLHDHGLTYQEGPLVRIIDISELEKTSPNYDNIKAVNYIDAGDLAGTGGINHQGYDSTGRYILVTASGKSGANGRLLVVDTQNNGELVANTEVGSDPHGIAYTDFVR